MLKSYWTIRKLQPVTCVSGESGHTHSCVQLVILSLTWRQKGLRVYCYCAFSSQHSLSPLDGGVCLTTIASLFALLHCAVQWTGFSLLTEWRTDGTPSLINYFKSNIIIIIKKNRSSSKFWRSWDCPAPGVKAWTSTIRFAFLLSY